MKIYLAGKMTGWRHSIVEGLRDAEERLAIGLGERNSYLTSEDWSESYGDCHPCWPVLRNTIGNTHDYVGPYLVESCAHGCPKYHGVNDCVSGACVYGDEGNHGATEYDREWVVKSCLSAIRAADLVFAHLEPGAHATLFELGFALALGKPIYINKPESVDDEDRWGMSDQFWFTIEACSLGYTVHNCGHNDEPGCGLADAIAWFYRAIGKDFVAIQERGTHIERAFFEAWRAIGGEPLDFQYQVGRYKIDFAHVATKTAIELDGLVGHSSPSDIEKDRVRQRWIESQGWRFIRFGGREVTQNARKCACETAMFIAQRQAA